jgi:4-amino-4-deoxy-L-arabinose transferase-like glycosyltransferase
MQPGMSRAAWVVVLVACVVRLGFAGATGLGIDESYMVAAASSFDVSYFDHPPVSWFLELLARFVVGNEDPLTVRLPFVAVSVLSSWLLYVLTNRLYGAAAAFWAVVGYSVSPVFSLAFGCWVLPDGPLDTALLAAAYALVRALGIGGVAQPRWWWAAGGFAGLALLSKYSAGLVLLGAAVYLLTDPVSRPALRGWRPWAAGVLAVAMFCPVVWWNAAHGWQSFHYQSSRASGLRLHFTAPLTIWGGEALFILPWVWLPMICLLLGAFRRGPADRPAWLLAMLAVIPVISFAVTGIWSSTHILYHWAAPGYLMLFPLLGAWAASWRRPLRNAITVLSAVLLATAAGAIAAEESFPFVPDMDLRFPPGKSPLLQALDWDSLRDEFAGRDVQAVAALRWYDAGKVGYALRGALPITVFGAEPHQFGISTPPSSLLGKNVLLLAMPGDVSAITRQYAPYFKTLSPAPALTVTDHGAVLLVIPALQGTDLLRAPPQ